MAISWGSEISFIFAVSTAAKKDKLIKHYVQYCKGGQGFTSSINQWPNQKNISEWLKKDDPKESAGGFRQALVKAPKSNVISSWPQNSICVEPLSHLFRNDIQHNCIWTVSSTALRKCHVPGPRCPRGRRPRWPHRRTGWVTPSADPTCWPWPSIGNTCFCLIPANFWLSGRASAVGSSRGLPPGAVSRPQTNEEKGRHSSMCLFFCA